MTKNYTNAIEKASTFLKEKGMDKPEVGLILGSGLGELANEAENAVIVPYEEIPEFPVSTVEGHAGQLVYGDLGGKKFWQCKDVSITTKGILCKKLHSLLE